MSDPDHTARRLVGAAERLFAEGGEEATSLRAITREARSNAAAVHYHFGGRDELLRAVIDQYLGPLALRRAHLLDLAKAHGEPVPVDVLVAAAVRPDLELLAALRPDRVEVARLLGRSYTRPGTAVADLVQRRFEELVQQVLPMLRRSLPSIDEGELRQRLRLVLATVVFVFATAPDPGPINPLGTDDVDEQVRRLVAFCAAGLSSTRQDRPAGQDGHAGPPSTGRAGQAGQLIFSASRAPAVRVSAALANAVINGAKPPGSKPRGPMPVEPKRAGPKSAGPRTIEPKPPRAQPAEASAVAGSTGKARDTAAGKAGDRAGDTAAGKAADRASDTAAGKAADSTGKATGRETGKSAGRETGKSAGRETGKSARRETGKASEKAPEKKRKKR